MSWFRRRRIDPSRAAFCRAAFTRAEPLEPRWLLAAPELVYELHTNTAPSQPTPPVELNGAYYFTANDGVHGRELWRTDGTPAGTTMVKELIAGASATSGFSELYRAGNLIYFTAAGSLYRTDGTDPGTVRGADVAHLPGRRRRRDRVLRQSSSFYARLGFELWKSDGTPRVRPSSRTSSPASTRAPSTPPPAPPFAPGRFRRHAVFLRRHGGRRDGAVEERRHRRGHRAGEGHQARVLADSNKIAGLDTRRRT